MRKTVSIDLTEGYGECPSVELVIRLRVPVLPESNEQVTTRVSLDHQLEQIRRQMRAGTAAKDDEDNLVVFRLLQAFGFEYWPLDTEDL